jgi:hypothetical protein
MTVAFVYMGVAGAAKPPQRPPFSLREPVIPNGTQWNEESLLLVISTLRPLKNGFSLRMTGSMTFVTTSFADYYCRYPIEKSPPKSNFRGDFSSIF